jgi:hypothetical protein
VVDEAVLDKVLKEKIHKILFKKEYPITAVKNRKKTC